MSSKIGGVIGSTLGLLGWVFIILQVVGVIDWSWWAVTSPWWGALILALTLNAISKVGLAILDLFDN